MSCMPSGAPSIDGDSSTWLEQAHPDVVYTLCTLLDRADVGQLPHCWSDVRVVFIPKDAAADPNDRRPPTIMALTYRIWSRFHANAIIEWFAAWRPSGLTRIIAAPCCPDIIWERRCTCKMCVTFVAKLACTTRTSTHASTVLTWTTGSALRFLWTSGPACMPSRTTASVNACWWSTGKPTSSWLRGDHMVGVPQRCALSWRGCPML